MLRRAKLYYSLTKPGVLYGNVITGVSGYVFGALYFDKFAIVNFLATIIGMSLIIGSACAVNNVLDRDIDKLMERTKSRVVVSGAVSPRSAMIFAFTIGALGLALLALFVNWLVVGLGIFGFIVYVWLYGALGKRQSVHGTIAGSVSGAMPIVAGYVAVAGRLDIVAGVLFLILFFWQFPEFYSISIFRREEYKMAKIPVISIVNGIEATKKQIFVYSLLFVLSTLVLTPLGYTGYIYLIVMTIAGGYLVFLSYLGFKSDEVDTWARQIFRYSIRLLVVFSLLLPLGVLLP